MRIFVAIIVISMCSNMHNTYAMEYIVNFYRYMFPIQHKQKEQQSDYSINLMWVNEERKKSQLFIHPVIDQFAPIVCKWAALNKNGVVNVWYDEEMTTADAIENTQQAITQECLQYPEKAPVVLKNVRKLRKVKKHPRVFSNKIPIFFRVDLLRAIAGFNHVSRGKVKNFVYSDLDGEPISKDQIFDEKTKKDLEQYSMIMARPSEFSGQAGFENSFQIISNHKPNLLQAKKFALINLNIKRAYDTLDRNLPTKSLEQKVYRSYECMYEYFYHLEKMGKFKVLSEKGWIDEQYCLKSFGEYPFHFNAHLDWCKGGEEADFIPRTFIPTKEVKVPLSAHFGPKKED